MPAMKELIDVLTESGMRDRVKIIVGGAPVTQEFAHEIGADGYGPNAPDAVQLAKRLLME
jgi:5-methyltetrahydrofolate--homocysteine methyltransferase